MNASDVWVAAAAALETPTSPTSETQIGVIVIVFLMVAAVLIFGGNNKI